MPLAWPVPGSRSTAVGHANSFGSTSCSASRTWNRARSAASTSGARRRSAMTSAPPETSMRGSVHRALQVEAAVREHRADLQHGGQDAPPARRAERQPWRAAPHRDHGAHVGQRALAGRDRVGPARARVEPHHAVVEQDAGRRRHDLAAERRQQGLGQADHGAGAVDHAQMRRAGGVAAVVDVAHAGKALAVGGRAAPRPRRHRRRVPARRAAPCRAISASAWAKVGPAVESARRGEGRAARASVSRGSPAARPVAGEVLQIEHAARGLDVAHQQVRELAGAGSCGPASARRSSVSARRPSGRCAGVAVDLGAGGRPPGR